MNVGEMVGKYLQVRDKANALKKDHKAQLEPYVAALDKLEGLFAEHMTQNGVDNLKTDVGTAFATTRTSVTTPDKLTFLEYVRENDAWHLLDIRPSKSAVQEFVEETNVPPPGVSMTRIKVVNVRKT